ncbi:MAG TPA: hypothetical protein VML50_12030 [Anaeromyxobacter sp.]|nr:hypothetical protein [Anaeromyxobacter sp.]
MEPIRAPRESARSCRGWVQEAALRMLMNNLDPEVAERPEDLVVYGGTGKAARDWESYRRIVAALRAPGDDETGLEEAFSYRGFVPAYLRPMFCEGKGPFRWVALSGDPADIARTDRALAELLPDNAGLRRWLELAGRRLVNAANGASWVSFHHGGGVGIGWSLHAGQVIVADGTAGADRRLERVLRSDPAMGVLRRADAGYPEAARVARERGIKLP